MVDGACLFMSNQPTWFYINFIVYMTVLSVHMIDESRKTEYLPLTMPEYIHYECKIRCIQSIRVNWIINNTGSVLSFHRNPLK